MPVQEQRDFQRDSSSSPEPGKQTSKVQLQPPSVSVELPTATANMPSPDATQQSYQPASLPYQSYHQRVPDPQSNHQFASPRPHDQDQPHVASNQAPVQAAQAPYQQTSHAPEQDSSKFPNSGLSPSQNQGSATGAYYPPHVPNVPNPLPPQDYQRQPSPMIPSYAPSGPVYHPPPATHVYPGSIQGFSPPPTQMPYQPFQAQPTSPVPQYTASSYPEGGNIQVQFHHEPNSPRQYQQGHIPPLQHNKQPTWDQSQSPNISSERNSAFSRYRPHDDAESTDEEGSEDIYIAVMGVTGAGKSSFIELCIKELIKVGHGLMSCTMEVDEYQFVYKDYNIHLIDTPGFDDTTRSDTEVLRDIAGWLGAAYKRQTKLSGIIYLHRISDPRMAGSAKRNLHMFKKLCGEECFSSVILATTMWGLVDERTGDAREAELVREEDFWGFMAKRGSKVMRHYGDRESAMRIVKKIVKQHQKGDGDITLRIQKEIVDEGMDLNDTAAGKHINEEINRLNEKHKKELESLEQERREALAKRDLESAESIAMLQRNFEEKIAKGEKDREDLKVGFEKLQEQRAKELAEMEEQRRRHEEVMRKREEELREMQAKAELHSYDRQYQEDLYKKNMELELMRKELAMIKERNEKKQNGVLRQIVRIGLDNTGKIASVGLELMKHGLKMA